MTENAAITKLNKSFRLFTSIHCDDIIDEMVSKMTKNIFAILFNLSLDIKVQLFFQISCMSGY